jgi:hypothetical protein
LNAHPIDADPEPALKLGDHILRNARKEAAAQIFRNIVDPTVCGREVNVVSGIGIKAAGARADGAGNATDQTGFDEGLKGVVHRGKTQARLDGTHGMKELICRRVRLGCDK